MRDEQVETPGEDQSGQDTPKGSSARSLWIGVGLAFGLMAVAWTVMFMVASRNPVETVPLEHYEP